MVVPAVVCPGLCYFSVSILGFWAFGTGVAGNVLLAFKAGPHQWVVTMATMLVVVHVAAAFQVGGCGACRLPAAVVD